MADDTQDQPISAWDQGKAEAAKRFGKDKPAADVPATGSSSRHSRSTAPLRNA